MYIANKPTKYGFKIFMVNDVDSFYCINGFPYLGRGSAIELTDDQNQGHFFVKQLMEPLMQPGRTIYHDN